MKDDGGRRRPCPLSSGHVSSVSMTETGMEGWEETLSWNHLDGSKGVGFAVLSITAECMVLIRNNPPTLSLYWQHRLSGSIASARLAFAALMLCSTGCETGSDRRCIRHVFATWWKGSAGFACVDPSLVSLHR